MANLDRAEIIELLGRLGVDDSEAALAAARELHRKVGASGLTWDDVVRTNLDASTDADDEPLDEPLADQEEAEAGAPSDADKAEAGRLIDGLLARKTLSDTTREDLTEMKRSIVEGSFDAMDLRYVRALARRLG
jgi:hypothetical protein